MAEKLVEVTMDKNRAGLRRVQREYQWKDSGVQYKKWVQVKTEEFKSDARRRHVREPEGGQRKPGEQPAQPTQRLQQAEQPQERSEKLRQKAQQFHEKYGEVPRRLQQYAPPGAKIASGPPTRELAGPQQVKPEAGGAEKPFKPARRRRGQGKYHHALIRRQIHHDKDFAMEQMLLMQEYQTPKERELFKKTKYKNVVGFNQPDSRVFTKFMDAIKEAGGLRRLQEFMGDDFVKVERDIQMRMAKYSRQLADIHNDDNRYRNFKTITDMFKEAKGIKSGDLANFTGGIQSRNYQSLGDAFVGQGFKKYQPKADEGIGKRGPKWRDAAIIKRFDNAKYAAEVYHMMGDIGLNDNRLIRNRFENYVDAQMQNDFGDVDQMMQERGFANLKMKDKNRLKDAMKRMAPYVADIFNAYKELGVGLPVGQKLRGKGLKSIKEDALLKPAGAGINREVPQAPQEPRRLSSRLREIADKFKKEIGIAPETSPSEKARREERIEQRFQQAEQRRLQREEGHRKLQEIERAKNAPERKEPAGEEIVQETVVLGRSPKMEKMLRDNEARHIQNAPYIIKEGDLRSPDDGRGCNGTYKIKGVDGNNLFYKPMYGERQMAHPSMMPLRSTIPKDYYVREALAYDVAKMVGLDDMFPPVKTMVPDIDRGARGISASERNIGAYQQDARDFGKMMGMKDVKAAGAHQNLNPVDDHDMMVFDFIIGNTDRHAGNYYVGKKGNKAHVLMIDHGLAFPNKAEVFYGDWFNTIGNWERGLENKGSKPISAKFQDGIMRFDNDKFRETAAKAGLDSRSAEATITRVSQLKEYIQRKNGKSFTLRDLKKIIESEHNYRLG